MPEAPCTVIPHAPTTLIVRTLSMSPLSLKSRFVDSGVDDSDACRSGAMVIPLEGWLSLGMSVVAGTLMC